VPPDKKVYFLFLFLSLFLKRLYYTNLKQRSNLNCAEKIPGFIVLGSSEWSPPSGNLYFNLGLKCHKKRLLTYFLCRKCCFKSCSSAKSLAPALRLLLTQLFTKRLFY